MPPPQEMLCHRGLHRLVAIERKVGSIHQGPHLATATKLLIPKWEKFRLSISSECFKRSKAEIFADLE